MTTEPVLKIFADKQASYLALKYLKRRVKTGGVLTLLFLVVLLYFGFDKIDGLWICILVLSIISAGTTWLSYLSLPNFRKTHAELPLRYSFYPHGFTSHQGEQDYSWEHIASVQASETSLNLKMNRNPHKVVELAFICVSAESLSQILQHFKTYAPERISKGI